MIKIITIIVCVSTFNNLYALDVKLTADKDYVEVLQGNKLIRVQRIQDQNNTISGVFSKTSRKCPPFCIQPLTPVEGIEPVTEYEILKFMENELALGEGVLIDARVTSWHNMATIPGSINIPFTHFEKEATSKEVMTALVKLGAIPRGKVSSIKMGLEKLGLMDGDLKTESWDFSNAKKIILWCNGMWCGQSPRAAKALVKLGYPKSRILYFRGGMQSWMLLGLTVVKPEV